MSRTVRMAVAASAVALLMSACSSASPDAGSPTSADTGTSAPAVSVDPGVRDELDPADGEVVVPGSIDSVEQDLTGECAAAVAPLRTLMGEHPNVFSMPADDMATFNAALPVAKQACGGDAGQEWVDFYTLELAGWMYAENPDGAQ